MLRSRSVVAVGPLLWLLLSSTVAAGQTRSEHLPSEPRELRFRSGELELAGLWFTPDVAGPHPAAVIVRGSGPSRRDNPWARLFVNLLLERGVAVLLTDKRGSGASEGDWRRSTFDDRADDALAAFMHLRARPDVDPDRVGLVGLSQGGRIVPMVAARSQQVAFVVNVVGSAVPFTEQIRHEMTHTFREAGLAGASLEAAMRLNRLAEEFVRRAIPWHVYRAALDSALASDWSHVAQGFPDSVDHWRWSYFRGVIDFDPLPYWREVEAPTLVLYGSEDANAPVARSAARLEAALEGAEPTHWDIRVFEGLGHGLLAPMRPGDHTVGLHPDVVTALSEWLGRVLGEH